LRIAVFTGHAYQREGNSVYADRAFVLFVGYLVEFLDRVVLLGRLDPHMDRARYELSPEVAFVALPHYHSLARPVQASVAMLRSLPQAWRALDGVDGIWVLGPHPLGFALIAFAVVRRRGVVLGVRQDTIAYVRSRHPGRPLLFWAGAVLEGAWRLLARFFPTVAVGPDLAEHYRHSRQVHELTVSLVSRDRLAPGGEVERRTPGNVVTILSVGRLEDEKNPLMLPDVLSELQGRGGRRWRLVVCGEGLMEEALLARLADLGLEACAELRGYVPFDELLEDYRSADVLLSTSWTEGFPQVFVEAFAAGLPVVATDVGGIRKAAGETVMLVPPGDVEAAAEAIHRTVEDDELRRRLVEAGLDWAALHTTEVEIARLAEFLLATIRGNQSADR